MGIEFAPCTGESLGRSTEEWLLAERVRVVLCGHGATDWTEFRDGFSFSAQPPGYQPRKQGWKSHVSATPLSAVLVTMRAAEVLISAGCAFKVATGLPQPLDLNSPTCPREVSGKVITAYPDDDEQFVLIAERLHQATRHLPGPSILSNRQYRPDGLVYYRFGAFTGQTVLGNDGVYESMARAPDGRLVPDDRRPWFSPPSWALPCPVPDEPSPPPTSGPVPLADRFVVRTAIRHGNKGGVYVATDREAGDDVWPSSWEISVTATGRGSWPHVWTRGRCSATGISWCRTIPARRSPPAVAPAWPGCSRSCCAFATAARDRGWSPPITDVAALAGRLDGGRRDDHTTR